MAGAGGAWRRAFCSTFLMTSNGILAARRSALAELLTIRATIAWHLAILRVLPGLDGTPAITGGDLDTLAGVPGFKRMSIEAVGDDLPAAFPARWF
jgi:hypothetical protein